MPHITNLSSNCSCYRCSGKTLTKDEILRVYSRLGLNEKQAIQRLKDVTINMALHNALYLNNFYLYRSLFDYREYLLTGADLLDMIKRYKTLTDGKSPFAV